MNESVILTSILVVYLLAHFINSNGKYVATFSVSSMTDLEKCQIVLLDRGS